MMNTSPVQKRSLEILDYFDGDYRVEMMNDIFVGMSRRQKSIPSKYFYDRCGSWLFGRICRTPEYYPTRTELSILRRSAGEIMRFFSRKGGDLVELGSGSNVKIRELLGRVAPAALRSIRYVPVDISGDALREASGELPALFPGLEVLGIVADFTRQLDVIPAGRKMVTFLGGTIGNFSEEECPAFLRGIARLMGPEDRFLVGLDMVKPVPVIEAAYNDSHGLTRRFNLNVLRRINRELNGNIEPDNFEHLAFFNREKERVEMHLRARSAATFRIADVDLSVRFRQGETIRTEICQKFRRDRAERRFRRAGLLAARWFTDPKGWFSLVELRAL